jgi:Family of unknown function (DUF6272)
MTSTQLQFVSNIHQTMQSHRFLLSYRGSFSQDITLSLLGMMEHKLDREEKEPAIRKKVFHVMMECLQNICNTSDDSLDDNNQTMFLLGKNESEYFIFSSKLVNRQRYPSLKNRLESVNMMTADEMRIAYTNLISILSVEELSESEIGLIKIARKSGKKLEFEFAPIDENVVFFSMKTSIAAL